jgi:protein involved in plasmid replication-relaxation
MLTTTTTHYTLNTKQLALLRLLYRFRFATSHHLSTALDIKQDTLNQRLQILLDQEYIGRHYDGQYKIHGKPAEYYLLEPGIAALKQRAPDKCDNKVLHNLYKDKFARPSFVAHSLEVFTVYCLLKQRYGDALRFFTASQIHSTSYFPKQRPDAFIRLDAEGERKEFFLEVIDPNKPFFSYVGKVRRYIEYAGAETWAEGAGTRLPKILVVADTAGTEIRFQKQASRFLKRHYKEEPKMYTTNTDKLGTMKPGYDRVWRDVEESERVIALHEIQ